MSASFAAVLMPAPGAELRVERFPAPVLTPGAALLRTTCSEVCGTDVHLHHGRLGGVPYPIIPGHVSIGTIAELNGRVVDVEGCPFDVGDRVTFLDVHESCGRCFHCLVTKQTTRCPSRRVYGITYSANDGLLGGWSEAIWMKPGVHMARLPQSLDDETFIGGGCGLVTAVHALDRADVRLGDNVVVLGIGPVGQSAVALAALSGAGHVVAIGDPGARREFAMRMGATHALGLDQSPSVRRDEVLEITNGHGADVVIEASGAPDAVVQAFDLVRDGGRIVVCGHYTDNGDVRVHPHHHINRKHVELRGCWGSDFSHLYRAIAIATKHGDRVPWREMIGRRYLLSEADDALRAVESREVIKAVIIPR